VSGETVVHADRKAAAQQTNQGWTMPNPFENEDAQYCVLVNDEGQHSLWPSFAEIPGGWNQVLGPAERGACVEYVRVNWTDMRPRSLVEQLDHSS